MNDHPRISVALTLFLYFVAVGSPALAQGSGGRISGRVLDAEGTPVPNQRVQLRHSNQTLRLIAITDSNGIFTYAGVEPGRYVVEAVVAGKVVAERAATLSESGATPSEVTLTLPPVWVRSERHVTKLPRLSARQLLGMRGVAHSFRELEAALNAGHQVRLEGRELTVAAVSPDRLILLRRHWFSTEEMVLTQDAVPRLDIVDSTKNGTYWGLAVGGTLGAALAVSTHRYTRSRLDCNLCPLDYLMAVALPVVAGGLGAKIDHAITDPIYERRNPVSATTIAPELRQNGVAITARLQF